MNQAVSSSNRDSLQKWGGFAALYEALAYVIGIVGFLGVVNIAEVLDPVQKVALIAENQTILSTLHLIVYVAWGAALVVLALALFVRLQEGAPVISSIAAVFGFIWAGLIIASGMIYNIGMETVVGLYGQNPEQAATVWLAIESVFVGLGGGVEFVGGVWVLLLSWAALRSGQLPRLFNVFGFVVGASGVITVVPALGEIGSMVFGLSQIVWFIWLGIVLLRSTPEPAAAAAGPVAPLAT